MTMIFGLIGGSLSAFGAKNAPIEPPADKVEPQCDTGRVDGKPEFDTDGKPIIYNKDGEVITN